MGSKAKKIATYADLVHVPDNLVAEILASSSLDAELINSFQKGKGGPGG